MPQKSPIEREVERLMWNNLQCKQSSRFLSDEHDGLQDHYGAPGFLNRPSSDANLGRPTCVPKLNFGFASMSQPGIGDDFELLRDEITESLTHSGLANDQWFDDLDVSSIKSSEVLVLSQESHEGTEEYSLRDVVSVDTLSSIAGDDTSEDFSPRVGGDDDADTSPRCRASEASPVGEDGAS
eukprot:CAMPEP_0113697954 /NCGR_PEP_ID=MMETSP0038_2-20120614/22430_1 /TAXON_ID=2898 /ORGANISM="Cryptomonas paramecium" /LENGTH=181 /DNA_ID=CAMNT_0000621041 /DNA_START=127 /DNA_END=668 /DNA_ORIENTATION=- /assembly_acc=CAM_ASM_000170